MKKKLSFDYILMHIAYQLVAGVVNGFGIYMLVSRGFSASAAGMCVSLCNCFAIISQPLVSNYLDNNKKHNAFEATILFSIIVFILFVINSTIESASLFLAIIYILACGIYATIEPLLNSISNILGRNDVKVNFGVARACGSASYGVVCAVFGILSESISYKVVLIGGFIFALCLTFACIHINKDFKKGDFVSDEEDLNEKISLKDFFRSNSTFIFMCLALVGVLFGYFFIDSFALLIVEDLGGTSADMGIIQCIKAVIEALTMSQYQRIRKKLSLLTVIKCSVFFCALKILATFLAPNVLTIYFVQVLQAISFAMIIPSIIELINLKMRRNEVQRGHSLFTMTNMIACLFSSAVGGNIIDKFGVKNMTLIAFIVCLISCFIYSYFATKVVNKEK